MNTAKKWDRFDCRTRVNSRFSSHELYNTPYWYFKSNEADLENHMLGAFATLAQLRYTVCRDAAKLSGGAYGYMCLNSEDGWTKVNMTWAQIVGI